MAYRPYMSNLTCYLCIPVRVVEADFFNNDEYSQVS